MSLIKKIPSKSLAKYHNAEVECEVCSTRRIVRWYPNYTKETHLCRSCATSIGNTGGKRSKEARANMSKVQRALGNGGVRIQSGYTQLIVDTPHPRRRDRKNGKYVFEHILVIEEHIGRFLELHEIVHHIDGDKLNNSLNNLHVCSRSSHGKIYNSAEKAAFMLVKAGLLKFDPITEEYSLSTELATLASELL